MVLAVQMTIEIPQLQLIDNVADVLVGAGRGDDSRDSTVAT